MNEAAESVADAFVRAINRQDVDAMAALMAGDHRFVDSLGSVVEGREKMVEGWKSYFKMVPDYTIAVEEKYCDGPVLIMLGMAQGTLAREGRLSADRRWQTPVAIRAHIEARKIAEWRVYADNEPVRRLMR